MRVPSHPRGMESTIKNDKLTTVKSCEHQALKECLDRNQGNKDKCVKEWQEFQNLCSNNKK